MSKEFSQQPNFNITHTENISQFCTSYLFHRIIFERGGVKNTKSIQNLDRKTKYKK
jgi:hypothetical protein